MSLRHYQIQVNVEYKGISLEGIADYTKKDYCGTTMTSPFKGFNHAAMLFRFFVVVYAYEQNVAVVVGEAA